MKLEEIILNFINTRIALGKGSLQSDGMKLYSYLTCIAEWDKDALLINITKYSPTTSHHQNLLKRHCDRLGIDYIEINKSLPKGTYDLVSKR